LLSPNDSARFSRMPKYGSYRAAVTGHLPTIPILSPRWCCHSCADSCKDRLDIGLDRELAYLVKRSDNFEAANVGSAGLQKWCISAGRRNLARLVLEHF